MHGFRELVPECPPEGENGGLTGGIREYLFETRFLNPAYDR
jgi:hypothetical protein